MVDNNNDNVIKINDLDIINNSFILIVSKRNSGKTV